MYFSYDKNKSIHVPFPFNRVMTPYMTTDTADCPIDFSIHMTEWEPGAEVDTHAHTDAMEAMFCISGSGTAEVNGKQYSLEADSMIAAAPGETHCIRNTGAVPLKVLCIFSPPITAGGLRKRAEDAVKEYRKAQEKT